MKVFKRDVGAYAYELKEKGFILLKDILSDEFMNFLKDFHKKSIAGSIDESGAWRITGKKHQYVFSFPSDDEAAEFRDGMARLTGLNRESFTISERHLKQYEPNANPYPYPHKDRFASGFSIGLPVHLGPETSVCVFPTWDREPNMGDRAVFMGPDQVPDVEKLYHSPEAMLLHEELGDVIVFHGAGMWHERVRPAGTAVLYIKVNDAGNDPLGENIYGAKKASAKPEMAEAY